MSITVVGTVAVDTVETPFGKVTRALGGAATHFSAAASIYTKVNIIGIVGDDFPQEHIAFFKSRQINLEGLQVVPGKKTFHWEGKYDFDLNNAQTIATHLPRPRLMSLLWPFEFHHQCFQQFCQLFVEFPELLSRQCFHRPFVILPPGARRLSFL